LILLELVGELGRDVLLKDPVHSRARDGGAEPSVGIAPMERPPDEHQVLVEDEHVHRGAVSGAQLIGARRQHRPGDALRARPERREEAHVLHDADHLGVDDPQLELVPDDNWGNADAIARLWPQLSQDSERASVINHGPVCGVWSARPPGGGDELILIRPLKDEDIVGHRVSGAQDVLICHWDRLGHWQAVLVGEGNELITRLDHDDHFRRLDGHSHVHPGPRSGNGERHQHQQHERKDQHLFHSLSPFSPFWFFWTFCPLFKRLPPSSVN